MTEHIVTFDSPADIGPPPPQFAEEIIRLIRLEAPPGSYDVDLKGEVRALAGGFTFPTYYRVLDTGIEFAGELTVRGWEMESILFNQNAKCDDCGNMNWITHPHTDVAEPMFFCRNCPERQDGWPIRHPHTIQYPEARKK